MGNRTQSELRIAALSNPLSGRNKRGAFAKFEKIISRHPHIFHFVESSPQEITSGLDQFKRKKIDVILVNGGDGTIQTVLTYLKNDNNSEYKPYLVILPAGTTSMTFGDVGYRGN